MKHLFTALLLSFCANGLGNSNVPCQTTITANGIKLCLSKNGNVNFFGRNVAQVGTEFIYKEGYSLCHGAGEFPFEAWDFGISASGFKPATFSQPNGAGTSPVVVVRRDAGDQIEFTQTFELKPGARLIQMMMEVKNITDKTYPGHPFAVTGLTLRRALMRNEGLTVSGRTDRSAFSILTSKAYNGMLLEDATVNNPIKGVAKVVPANTIQDCSVPGVSTDTLTRGPNAIAIDYSLGSLNPAQKVWVFTQERTF